MTEEKEATDETDWLKQRDMRNEITFANKQIEKIKPQLADLEASVKKARNLCEEYRLREVESTKRDAELRQLIKAEKEKFRELNS